VQSKVDNSKPLHICDQTNPNILQSTFKMASSSGMVDPRIFEQLQTKIDEDAEVREQIKAITQTLERQGRNAQSILSRAHSTPAAHRGSLNH
jgi:hypothetical protein